MKRLTLIAAMMLAAASAAQAQLPAGTTDASESQSPVKKPDDILMTQANDALEKQDYATAVKMLTKLAAANPNDPHLFYDLGFAQENLGHDTEAQAAYRSAIAADTKYLAPHVALGLMLAREGKLVDAHAELVTAATLKLPPASTADQPVGDEAANDRLLTARALRALAELDRKVQPADARDELLAALKLSPETPDDILLTAEIAEALNDLPTADAAYRRLLAHTPDDPGATAALAHVLVEEKKAAEAEMLLSKALVAHPGDTAMTAQLASAYLAEEDPSKSALAAPLVETLHQQHPDETSITRLLARLFARTGQPEKAENLYAGLMEKMPDDPTLMDDRGANLLRLKRFAEAETLLKRAVEQPAERFPTPEDQAAAYSDLAFAASENNEPTITLQALDQRAKLAPNTAGSVFLAATAHDKLHQVKQASAGYKQFLAMANGKFPDQEWEARHRLIALERMK